MPDYWYVFFIKWKDLTITSFFSLFIDNCNFVHFDTLFLAKQSVDVHSAIINQM
jgi:hypothetical protein